MIDATPDRVAKAHTTIQKLAPTVGEDNFIGVVSVLGLTDWLYYGESARLSLEGLPDVHVVTLAAALAAIVEANPNGFD